MKRVVLLSGGVDSSTCLAKALADCRPEDVLAVNMYYGQRHDREIQSARDIAAHYGVELMSLDLSAIFVRSDCSLLKSSDAELPTGSYAEQQAEAPGKPVSTYVPFRNGLMLAAAASVADSVGATEIYYGAHADDAAGSAYPDCSMAFVEAMDRAICEGSGGNAHIVAPFIRCNKAQVVKAGLQLGVPYEKTWSCYAGGEKPCGQCGTCIDRLNAFHLNGVRDPLET